MEEDGKISDVVVGEEEGSVEVSTEERDEYEGLPKALAQSLRHAKRYCSVSQDGSLLLRSRVYELFEEQFVVCEKAAEEKADYFSVEMFELPHVTSSNGKAETRKSQSKSLQMLRTLSKSKEKERRLEAQQRGMRPTTPSATSVLMHKRFRPKTPKHVTSASSPSALSSSTTSALPTTSRRPFVPPLNLATKKEVNDNIDWTPSKSISVVERIRKGERRRYRLVVTNKTSRAFPPLRIDLETDWTCGSYDDLDQVVSVLYKPKTLASGLSLIVEIEIDGHEIGEFCGYLKIAASDESPAGACSTATTARSPSPSVSRQPSPAFSRSSSKMTFNSVISTATFASRRSSMCSMSRPKTPPKFLQNVIEIRCPIYVRITRT